MAIRYTASVTTTRVIDGKTETDVRVFVLSRKLSPRVLLETARGRWLIENGLHWHLDVSFAEDAARNRKDHGRAKHRSHPPPRARRRPARSEQGITDRQAETSGMERRIHAKAAESNAIALTSRGRELWLRRSRL
jgi:hypothetical protein